MYRLSEIWVGSCDTVIKNLMIARNISREVFAESRSVILPGIRIPISDILNGLSEMAGCGGEHLKERYEDILRTAYPWPELFDTILAESLGFSQEEQIDQLISKYNDRD